MTGNAVVVNFSGGETSPRSRGRFDQPWYQTSAKKMVNFIAEIQGPARFRPGTVFSYQTRLGAVARLIDFQVNDVLSYLLEFTPGYLRVRNPLTYALYTTTQASIVRITAASPAVVTVVSASGLSNGQEVILSNVQGMPGLNNKQFLIANLSSTTFNLADPVTNTLLDTSALAGASGGTASVVYEVAAPFLAIDLPSIQVAAADGTMYIVCPGQAPQKLTVDSANTFTIGTFSRTNDPFSAASALTVTAILEGTQTIVRFAAGTTFTPGGQYTFAAVSGATQINGGKYLLEQITSELFDANVPVAYGVQLQIAAGGISGSSCSVSFGTVTGVLGALLSNQTFWAQVAGSSDGYVHTITLYTDSTLATPVATGSGDGSFTSYGSWGNTADFGGHLTNVGGSNYTGQGSVFGEWRYAGPYYAPPPTPSAFLKTTAANLDVDSSGWSAYTSGGTAQIGTENPIAVAFYEGRLVYAGTNQRPDCLFLSMAPDTTTGNSRYDIFTGGSTAVNACFFQLAPTGGSSSYISWARGGPDYLFLGTFGGPYRVSGSGLDIPITPSSINVRQFDTAGAEETMSAGLAQMFFVQRAGSTVRSIKVINPYLATFESADMCLNAEQIGYSPIQRVVLQRGRPDALWVYRADGVLAGMSVHLTAQVADTLTGWHRHQLGGVNAKVVDIAVTQRQTGFDQLWMCVQRTINGASRCYVEPMADDVVFPDQEDFYGSSGAIVRPSDNPNDTEAGAGSKAADLANWRNAVWRLQSNYVHMDAEASYDGSLRGVTAGATLTPSAVGAVQVEGSAAVPITLTASQPVFTAADIGSEIWVKPNLVTGQGAGRATITAFTSSTVVSAVVTVPFSSATAFAAGDWFFAVSTFYGFGHLEGAAVAAVGDGAVISDGGQTGDADFPTLTVSQGTITLPAGNLGYQPRAAVFRAGLPYVGMIETHNLEMGGRSGPAQSKPRNIADIYIRFMNSLGCEYGTDLYSMQKIDHRLSDANYDRPAPVFSGLRRVKLEDSWSGLDDATREKNVFVTQRLPLPAVVQFLDLSYSVADDGGIE